jgi:BirA family biotin operon repressor/biotin-[acetyl-CoA-carboxylase] ligase
LTVIVLQEVPSTNGWLAERAADLPDGQWVRAERQTAGRGRQGRAWAMAPGNLAASVLVRLRPSDPPSAQLSFLAGVALHQVAAAYVAPARLMLKWPNDLLLDGAKLAGILCERAGDRVIAGFGVNLATAPAIEGRETIAFPPPPPDPDRFLEALAMAFEEHLALWRREGFEPLRALWLRAAHPLGTLLSLSGDPDLQGQFDGLEADGALRLRTAQGVRIVHAGDVALASMARETA